MREHVQSVRLFVDLQLAHFYTYSHDVTGQGKKPAGGDLRDILHGVVGAFADYFVTHESPRKRGLRGRYKLAAKAPPDPICVDIHGLLHALRER